jgi:hypothetical protein
MDRFLPENWDKQSRPPHMQRAGDLQILAHLWTLH